MSATDRACIIGAGCSGFTMAKRLKDHGVAYDCFEMSDNIGGNWYYKNPNGRSSCYQSLHIDTSKWRLAFEDYPVPESWPDFPHHSQIQQYFNDYVDHFQLRDTITFNTSVEAAVRLDSGAWEITLSNGETRQYRWLIVANGHHWDARLPDYPGLESFAGYQTHSHHYLDPFEPYDYRGKRVVVVGAGNSAMDIASELSQRPICEKLFVSMRRGVWVLPKYVNGKPVDKTPMPGWIPRRMLRALARRKIKELTGNPEDYGLPRPDHEPLDAHPSISSEFLTRVGSGDITPKGAIDHIDANGVVFVDGSREDVDAILWATGYQISFPFFSDPALQAPENRFPLFKRMVKPGYENLYFLGLAQAVPTLVNFAEQQSKWIVEAIGGAYSLPTDDSMKQIINTDEKTYLGNFYDTPRHTMQCEFDPYVADLQKDLALGRRRAGKV
ncbi:NAD(P)/FAD-dependent oxidoreductase [Halieaceae bacterium IMCC14734]|uniref:NAD(P)/FAD-dependent oxidoreductase n=1 Tax=Candidatus Litorirhabdus singularis TaxID=2518993 RepID=A0ABT3TK72_9GAMM|nr:NAD(P)-binding domain-containing protein [Candidatus Litorirhabdus singularis]MCX2981824.1 NAD(P)/FAD-dependent oxidoreductase [Candidatus Litorirhabdus singularis]